MAYTYYKPPHRTLRQVAHKEILPETSSPQLQAIQAVRSSSPLSLPPEFKSKVTHKIRLSMKSSILFSLLPNIFMFLVLRNLKLF